MRQAIITIVLQDTAPDTVLVSTSAYAPAVGRTLTPAEALATELLRTCSHQADQVSYLDQTANITVLRNALSRLLDPEDLGHAATAEMRDMARVALGMPASETTRYTCSMGVDIDAVHQLRAGAAL